MTTPTTPFPPERGRPPQEGEPYPPGRGAYPQTQDPYVAERDPYQRQAAAYPQQPRRARPKVDARMLWSGGVATAVVAGLVALVSGGAAWAGGIGVSGA